MLERVHRAWDRLHHGRPLLYRRAGDQDDAASTVDLDDATEDWRPMMTASLYCPGPHAELAVDCRPHKAELRASEDADCRDWCSLTLGRTRRRCRCAAAATTTRAVGDHAATPAPGHTPDEALPRFKSPVLGRRLRAVVADDSSSGSVSCPGSPRDIARLSAVVGRRLQLGLSPRLSTRRTLRRAAETAVDGNAQQPRQDLTVFDLLPHAVNCGRFCFWRRQSV